MSIEEGADKVISTIEDIGRRVLRVLERSAGNPPLLGAELVALGTAIKIVPQLDAVVWDFSGKHVPPLTDQNSQDPNPPPGTPPKLTYLQEFQAGALTALTTTLANPLRLIPGLGELFQPSPSEVQTQAATNEQVITGQLSPLAGLLKDIGIPTQITISEVLIIAGFILLAEPLIAAAGSIISAANPLKIG